MGPRFQAHNTPNGQGRVPSLNKNCVKIRKLEPPKMVGCSFSQTPGRKTHPGGVFSLSDARAKKKKNILVGCSFSQTPGRKKHPGEVFLLSDGVPSLRRQGEKQHPGGVFLLSDAMKKTASLFLLLDFKGTPPNYTSLGPKQPKSMTGLYNQKKACLLHVRCEIE